MNKYRAKIYRFVDGELKAAKLPVNADSVDEARGCAKDILEQLPNGLVFENIPDGIEIEQTG